jgi:hypothetical protein
VSEPDDQARQLKITLAPKVLYRPERSKFKWNLLVVNTVSA